MRVLYAPCVHWLPSQLSGIKNIFEINDVRILLQAAIKANASGIIVCHNHPSGNLNPSESDTKLTHKIKEAGNLMDIQLLDHLVLTMDDNYYSYADNGLL